MAVITGRLLLCCPSWVAGFLSLRLEARKVRKTSSSRFSSDRTCGFCRWFSSHHIAIFLSRYRLGTKSEARRGCLVSGHVWSCSASHFIMASRSKLKPVLVISGSTISSWVIGQRKSWGTSSSRRLLCRLLLLLGEDMVNALLGRSMLVLIDRVDFIRICQHAATRSDHQIVFCRWFAYSPLFIARKWSRQRLILTEKTSDGHPISFSNLRSTMWTGEWSDILSHDQLREGHTVHSIVLSSLHDKCVASSWCLTF